MSTDYLPQMLSIHPSRIRSSFRWTITIVASIAVPLFVTCREGYAQSDQKAVMLNIRPLSEGTEPGLLTRELVRQAFLIAARDEMGLATRDASLREDLQKDSDAEGSPFEISVSDEQQIIVKISKSSTPPVLLKELRLKAKPESGSIADVTSQVEALSRDEFVALLNQAGCKAKTRTPEGDAGVPVGAAEQLKSLSFLLHFAAIRLLHAEVRASGESPLLLAGLARSYAMLGTLTEFLWCPDHKVFKARALIYAERLHVKHPGELAFHTRAYVRALVGLHQAALDDLASAVKSSQGKQNPDVDLDEADVIGAFCKGDMLKLDEYTEEGPQQLFAKYLVVLLAESTQINELRVGAVQDLLQTDLNCLRAMDAVLDDAPLGIANTYSAMAPQIFSDSLFQEISQIAGLPKNVQKLAMTKNHDSRARVALVESLWKAGRVASDRGEPSLTVAGRLIQEASFIHIRRRLYLERHMYGWQTNDTLEASRLLVKGHPYAAYLDSFHTDPNVNLAAGQSLLKTCTDECYFEMKAEPLVRFIAQYGQTYLIHKATLLRRNDHVFRDLLSLARDEFDKTLPKQAAGWLREVSPYLPATIAASISYDWDYAAKHVEEWERDYRQDPLVQQTLGGRYWELQKLDDAERCLQRRIKALPDQTSYQTLARFYQTKGDDEKWVATLLESLQTENYGLESAQTHVALARHFMKKNDVKKGLEHADEAATSEASWALMCAAECHEQTGDWDGAEEFVKRNAKHYNDYAAADWYFWCRRTGQGDVKAARELAKPDIARNEAGTNPDEKMKAALFYYAEGDNVHSLELMRDAFAQNKDPNYALHAALLADETGDLKLRDTLLNDALSAARAHNSSLAELIHDFRNALLPPEKVIPLDLKVNEWRLHLQSEGEPTNRRYYLGKFLLLRGRVNEAIPLLQQSATSPMSFKEVCTFAGITLTRRGVKRENLRRDETDGKLGEILRILVRATAFLQRKQMEKALEQLSLAIELDPDLLDTTYVQALFDLAILNNPDAIENFSACLEQMPRSTDLLILKAYAQERERQYAEAILSYEKVIEIDPDRGRAYFSLANILATCQDDAFRNGERAVQMARKSLETDCEIQKVYRNTTLASALAEAGKFPEAIELGEETLVTSPPDARPYVKGVVDLLRQKKTIRRPPPR